MAKWMLASTAVVVVAVAYFGQFSLGTEHDAAVVKSPATVVSRLPATTRITRSSDLSTLSPTESTYRVTCRVKCDSLSFQTPAFTIRDGERVTISDACETQHVVATRNEGAQVLPIARELMEGTVFQITVLAVDQDNVLVDVAATLQSVKPVVRTGKSDSLRVNTLNGRFVEKLKLGETSSASFGEKDVWCLEVIVENGQSSSSESAEQLSAAETGFDG